MRSLDIKNLCIALEALSRIPQSTMLSSRIESLLVKVLKQEENTPHRQTHVLEPDLDNDIPI